MLTVFPAASLIRTWWLPEVALSCAFGVIVSWWNWEALISWTLKVVLAGQPEPENEIGVAPA